MWVTEGGPAPVISHPSGVIIPDECVKYIRWQRSRYTFAKFANDEDVKRDLLDTLAQQFAQLEPLLPKRVTSILDIGCGSAVIDVFLMRKFPDAKLELLDGDGEALEHRGEIGESGIGGWHPDGDFKPFCSRAHTEKLLAANGIRVHKWHDIGTKERMRADLVISFQSCGFHYPISTYNFSGTCIMDVRKGTEQQIGTVAQVIMELNKYERLIWER